MTAASFQAAYLRFGENIFISKIKPMELQVNSNRFVECKSKDFDRFTRNVNRSYMVHHKIPLN